MTIIWYLIFFLFWYFGELEILFLIQFTEDLVSEKREYFRVTIVKRTNGDFIIIEFCQQSKYREVENVRFPTFFQEELKFLHDVMEEIGSSNSDYFKQHFSCKAAFIIVLRPEILDNLVYNLGEFDSEDFLRELDEQSDESNCHESPDFLSRFVFLFLLQTNLSMFVVCFRVLVE